MHPVLRQRESPSSSGVFGLGTLESPTSIRFMWTCDFGVSWFTDSLRPAELLASLADLTGHLLPSQQRLLPPSFRPSRSPSSPSDISTVASAPPPTGLSPVRTTTSFAAPPHTGVILFRLVLASAGLAQSVRWRLCAAGAYRRICSRVAVRRTRPARESRCSHAAASRVGLLDR